MNIIKLNENYEYNKTTYMDVSELLCLSDIGVEALPLPDNERPFPPEYYARRFGYKGAATKEGTYEYRNDLLFYSHTENKFRPYRLFIKDIKVTTGQITFIVENGDPIIVKDWCLNNNIRADDETYLSNEYESFWGKKSILKHHSASLLCLKGSYGWLNEVDVYSAKILTECIHDGVTSFIIHDFGEFEDGFEIADYLKKVDTIYEYNNHYDSDDYEVYGYYAGVNDEIIIDDDEIPF